jgi:2-polyprenyl-6-methoxyphenol hydroxylase-like FAD-dependent oxidoreductase
MNDVEVLVAGAGPVGLFLAAELRRRGRSCIVIERNQGPSSYSKALAIMPRTLEIFDIAGIGAQFSEAINRVDGVRFVTPRASAHVAFGTLQTTHPYIGILPQYRTEEILRMRLQQLGGGVRYGHEFIHVRTSRDAVCATVKTQERTYEINARYLIGCDGVRSAVRQCAGIPFEGGSYPEGALLADVHVSTHVPPNEARVHIARHGIVTMFPIDDEVRRVVVISPGETLPQEATRAWLQQRLIRAHFDGTVLTRDPVWSSAFRAHHRVARHLRRGNVFLAGDAAHTHSPVGGQGMNIGLHDAWNLSWKLGAVLGGEAPESLLDTYEPERLPVADEVVRRTDVLTKALAHPHPIARIGRELFAPLIARIPLVNEPLVRELSQLDVPYAKRAANLRLRDGTRLYERLGKRYAVVSQLHGYPHVTLSGADYLEAVMEEERERIMLVRPDGYIAFEQHVTDWDDALRAALLHLNETGIRATA